MRQQAREALVVLLWVDIDVGALAGLVVCESDVDCSHFDGCFKGVYLRNWQIVSEEGAVVWLF